MAKRQWRELTGGQASVALPVTPTTPRRPRGRRWSLVIVAVVVVWAAAAAVFAFVSGRGWVRGTSLGNLREEGVVYLADRNLFIVANGNRPVALSARSPHLGERLLFCGLNDTFIDQHGDAFDTFGVYLLGPAPRGMDRVAVRVKGGTVEVNPGKVTAGPGRSEVRPRQPLGPFCQAPAPEGPPGFFRLPRGGGGGTGIPPVPV